MYTFQLQLEPHIQQPQYEQDTISTGASYLHVSSRASIYKPLGRLRPHSDKTPGGIFRGFEHGPSTQVLYIHIAWSKFKVYSPACALEFNAHVREAAFSAEARIRVPGTV